MTNKDKYIKAFNETIKKYLNPAGHKFFDVTQCPVCILTANIGHVESVNFGRHLCKPCPMASKDEERHGCVQFESMMSAKRAYDENDRNTDSLEVIEAFECRVNVLKKILKKIKEWEGYMFTIKGWKEYKWPRGW